ncbi:MAG: hypothetical protein RBS07_15065 [Lentimicrobium sp.]|jgi:hypothetical protein|nr:hypothetical protein [Lentimicrobium sp.]
MDTEVIKSLIVAGLAGFVGSGAFSAIVRASIKKIIQKLVGTVGELKDENIISQQKHDAFVTYINKRDDKLIERITDLLHKIPDPTQQAWMYDYLRSIPEKIDAFLNEEAGDDE